MKTRPKEFIPASQAAALLDAALAYLDGDFRDERQNAWEEDSEEEDRAADNIHGNNFRLALAAIRFATAQLAGHGRPEDLPRMAAAMDLLGEFDDSLTTAGQDACDAVGTAMEVMRRVTREVEQLADSPHGLLRHSLAMHLDPQVPGALELLERLSADPDPTVHRAATLRLGDSHVVPWWRGVFSSDPVGRVPPDEADKVLPVLGTLRELVEADALTSGHKKLAGVCAALPDVLLVDLAERVLPANSGRMQPREDLMAALLQRPGAVAAVLRMFEKQPVAEARFALGHVLETSVKVLPSATRFRLGMEFVDWLFRMPAEVRTRRHEDGPARELIHALGNLFPEDGDAGALLERVLALEPPRKDAFDFPVAHVAGHGLDTMKQGREAWLERVAEARLQDWPGAWEHARVHVEKWLDDAPVPLLRRFAERALDAETATARAWGVELLTGAAHQRADGPRLKVLERMWEQPRLREAILADHDNRLRAVSILRRELRSGNATPEMAVAAIRAVSDLWGGAGNPWLGETAFGHRAEPAPAPEYKPFLGPKALHGPITEEEWMAYRKARASFRAGDDGYRQACPLLPPGPWHPEDRAFLERVLGEAATDGGMAMAAALMLCAKAQPDDAEVWTRVLKLGDADDRRWTANRYSGWCKALGLPRTPRQGASTAAAGDDDDEWMDEDE